MLYSPNETSGQKLKRELGLESFPHVKYRRFMSSTNYLFVVYYNSHAPERPITNRLLKKIKIINILRINPDEHKFIISPAFDLETYDGDLSRKAIICIDICGYQIAHSELLDESKIDIKTIKPFIFLESIYKLFEEKGYTIPDLRKNAWNPHEKKFYDIRMEHGSHGIKLMELWWNDRNTRAVEPERYSSTLTLIFKVTPTWEQEVKNLSPTLQKSVKDHYVFKLQFRNINQFIGTREEFLSLDKSDQVDFIKQIMRIVPVRLWSSDYSWYYQGNFENAVTLDYSIYKWPKNAPRATGRWAKIKTGSTSRPYYGLSKHSIEILRKMPLFINKIVKMINYLYQEKE